MGLRVLGSASRLDVGFCRVLRGLIGFARCFAGSCRFSCLFAGSVVFNRVLLQTGRLDFAGSDPTNSELFTPWAASSKSIISGFEQEDALRWPLVTLMFAKGACPSFL